MSTNQNPQFKNGLFVTAGLIVIVVSVLMLGGDRAFLSRYTIFQTRIENVSGINIGSVVSLAGLNVGNVKAIEFDAQNQVIISFTVNQKHQNLITESSTVDVRTQGALGDKYLFINPGTPGEKPFDPNQVIPAAQGQDLIGALTEKGGEATKIVAVISEVHKLMKSINNQNRTEIVMSNLVETTQNLKTLTRDLQMLTKELKPETGEEIRTMVKKLNSIVDKVDRGEGTLGALINDSSLHEQIKSFLGASPRKQSMKTLIRSSIEKSEKN